MIFLDNFNNLSLQQLFWWWIKWFKPVCFQAFSYLLDDLFSNIGHYIFQVPKNTRTKLWTLWKIILLQKLSVIQLDMKFPTFDGTWSIITIFTKSHHLVLSWAIWIHLTNSHSIYLRSTLILSSHLCLSKSTIVHNKITNFCSQLGNVK